MKMTKLSREKAIKALETHGDVITAVIMTEHGDTLRGIRAHNGDLVDAIEANRRLYEGGQPASSSGDGGDAAASALTADSRKVSFVRMQTDCSTIEAIDALMRSDGSASGAIAYRRSVSDFSLL